jgi:hypothetical protein
MEMLTTPSSSEMFRQLILNNRDKSAGEDSKELEELLKIRFSSLTKPEKVRRLELTT